MTFTAYLRLVFYEEGMSVRLYGSLDVFLDFHRVTLLSSFSESATNRNSEEQLLLKLPEKSAKCLSSKDVSCMAITCNFTFNKTFTILALSFLAD